ncbi:MAG: 3-deoxy-7-phosphoheptulonate synthase [Fibrobacterota bacterium]
MNVSYVRKIPKVEEILADQPIDEGLKKIKNQRDEQIKAVFEKKSDKFLVIIGPCSAHDEDAVIDYVNRLARVQEKTADKLIIIPRIYTNKPRTTGQGYKGMLHQPDHRAKPNVSEGIRVIRQMHLRSLRESNLSGADEMLYPGNHPYLEDVLSYVAIGARSVENQQHRLTASGLNIPVGMKNPTSGDQGVLLNSIKAAQHSHIFVYNGWEVQTRGNPFAHAILRGSINQYGQTIPNYHYDDLVRLAESYEKRDLQNPLIIVDTNHDNSAKKYKQQPRIALEVLRSRNHSQSLKLLIRGLMIESYIAEGKQDPEGNVYGQSITDPCLGWEESEKLLYDIADCI